MGNNLISTEELPDYDQDDVMVLTPEKILHRRQINRDGVVTTQWFVQWKDMDKTEASWEDSSFMINQFPQFKF